MAIDSFGNDDVESIFVKGIMGKERQKILKSPKQQNHVWCVDPRSNRTIKKDPTHIVDVETRSCNTTASHLSDSYTNQIFVEKISPGRRIGLEDEIVFFQFNNMLNTNVL